MFGPAQRGVAMAVADCVEDGTIPADESDESDEADDLLCYTIEKSVRFVYFEAVA